MYHIVREAHKKEDYVFKMIIKIFKYFAIPKTSLILDTGCGRGQLVYNIYKEGYENIFGFDILSDNIKFAKDSFKEVADRFAIHDLYSQQLPDSFPKNNYDVIFSLNVIEHTYSPIKYLENIKFWLKKDGILIISTPYHGYIKNFIISLFNKFDWHFDPLDEGGHIKFFSKKTFYKIIYASGLYPIRFYCIGNFPFVWKEMLVVAKKYKD